MRQVRRLTQVCSVLALAAIVAWLTAETVAAQGTTFTYQGRLTDNGSPANGVYDMQFTLYDALTAGTPQGSPSVVVANSVTVTSGIFAVALDFGASGFPGADRFVEIGVRPAGSPNPYSLLSPRERITSTPYAIRSANATQLGGIDASQYVVTNDSRLSDPRPPTGGSTNYIQNTTSPQAANFNISGNGIVGGKFGIGTSPTAKLEVLDTSNNGLRVQTNASGGTVASFGGNGAFRVDASGVSGGRFTVLENGNIGIGQPSPGFPLNFASTLGDKISLWGNSGAMYGFGIQGSLLQIHTDIGSSDIAFGFGSSGSFTERMRFRGSGAIAIGGNDGQTGQVITSNGASAAPQWKSPTNTLYQQTFMVADTGFTTPSSTPTLIPGLSQTVNVSGNALIIVQFGVRAVAGSCFACGASSAQVEVYIDGGRARRVFQDIANGTENFVSGSTLLSVGAGSHTIEIRGESAGPLVNFGCGVACADRSSMIVQVIPE